MKKQLLNVCVAFAATLFLAGSALAQLTPPVKSLNVPAIAAGTMDIDGIGDEAAYSAAEEVTEVFNAPEGLTGDADISGSIKVCWNYVGFYIFFDISDDVAHNFNGTDGNSYEFDNVELFFNYDTAGVAAAGALAPDGIQLRYCRGLDGSNGMPGWGNSEPAKAAGYDTVATDYVQVDGTGNWQVEILVPWLYILDSGKLPEDVHALVDAKKTSVMGFDVSIADSDGSGTTGARDGQIAWDADGEAADADEDNAWQDVRKFGLVTLTGTPISSVKPTANGDFQVYPNPATNMINFSNLEGVTSIEIVNMVGQIIKVVDVTSNNVVVNVSDLERGNYVAKMNTANGVSAVRFVK